jgi:hypothetical protein
MNIDDLDPWILPPLGMDRLNEMPDLAVDPRSLSVTLAILK